MVEAGQLGLSYLYRIQFRANYMNIIYVVSHHKTRFSYRLESKGSVIVETEIRRLLCILEINSKANMDPFME
jgi:hypothetical protein